MERFNRTLLDEWAYARVYTSNRQRARALDRFIHTYSHHRGHTALGGEPPITRTNLAGQHTGYAVAWSGGAIEIDRHSLSAAVELRLALCALTLLVVDQVVKRIRPPVYAL